MKKLLTVAVILLLSFSVFAESPEETGDVSGNDLNPVVRGLNFEVAGGILAFVGKAGGKNAGNPIGTAFKFNFGYDIPIKNAVNIGISASLGMLQYNANPNDKGEGIRYNSSPWVGDYNPLTAGVELEIAWMITQRWDLGLLINFDYHALSKTYKAGNAGNPKKINKGNFAVGGGLFFEYYTFSRHFSLGLSAEFNYIIDFDGMNIIVTPFMKYSF
ncbi:MAG: adventurous gliding motility protein CglE [bacterium]